MQLMVKIINDCKLEKDNGQDKVNGDEPNVDAEAETWCMYNENNNAIFHEYLFGDSLGNNEEIIDNQISNILEKYEPE